jgi:quercetin dioxygenase-like cupin family protein
MKIIRWRADRRPTKDEVENMFKDEGMEFTFEEYAAGALVKDHKHPFDEVRMVIAGALRYNVAGNEFILREGDRLELPSNTRHSTKGESTEDCLTIIGFRVV